MSDVFSQLARFSNWLDQVVAELAAPVEATPRAAAGRTTRAAERAAVNVRDLSWRQFEAMVAEVYRSQGYDVEMCGSPAGDGGVDVILRKSGCTTFVQCKHWAARKVGVRPVRELLGVVVDAGADAGIVVTSGTYTQQAIAFARGNPLQLIDGIALSWMTGDATAPPRATDSPLCPNCRSAMTERVARKGRHVGKRFWGCPRYPNCRGVRSID